MHREVDPHLGQGQFRDRHWSSRRSASASTPTSFGRIAWSSSTTRRQRLALGPMRWPENSSIAAETPPRRSLCPASFAGLGLRGRPRLLQLVAARLERLAPRLPSPSGRRRKNTRLPPANSGGRTESRPEPGSSDAFQRRPSAATSSSRLGRGPASRGFGVGFVESLDASYRARGRLLLAKLLRSGLRRPRVVLAAIRTGTVCRRALGRGSVAARRREGRVLRQRHDRRYDGFAAASHELQIECDLCLLVELGCRCTTPTSDGRVRSSRESSVVQENVAPPTIRDEPPALLSEGGEPGTTRARPSPRGFRPRRVCRASRAATSARVSATLRRYPGKS